jgi:hypothetical protein
MNGWLGDLSPLQFVEGLIGRAAKPPPQFGHTFRNTVPTQVAQNVHSYEQMRASSEAGGSALLQCSQVGRSSSTWSLPRRLLRQALTART